MERSKIPMLSRFDLISHIMPYYGQTHRAFLLLSGLCSETRQKLDEFYDEFVTCMTEYWMLLIRNPKSNLNCLFLPNDLFEISIKCKNKESTKVLIKLILNLRDSKGWYFNSHYMHSKIKIQDPISVKINYVKDLYAYIDVLKSTQVTLCKWNYHNSKDKYELSTFDTSNHHSFLILNKIYIYVYYVYKFQFF